jgi:hypothetical protein
MELDQHNQQLYADICQLVDNARAYVVSVKRVKNLV